MARSEARLLVDIWADPDFTARTSAAQQRFMFLLSQSDLAHDGVIPLRPGRWARKSADATITTVRAELAELAQARFIVVDEDTEEVLVRSFVRRDRVYKQPNVMRAAIDHVALVESAVILAALDTEIRRIRAENPDLTGQQLETLAEMANVLVERVPERDFGGASNSSPNPSAGAPGDANPCAKGSHDYSAERAGEVGAEAGNGLVERVARNSLNPSANPSANPSRGAPGERGGVVSASTENLTLPEPQDPRSPVPGTTPLASLATSSPPREKSRSKPKRRIPDDFAATPEMVAWARETTPLVGKRDHDAFGDYWRGNGTTKADWNATWRNWMRRAQTDAERNSPNGSRASPHPKPSTTDQRVADALTLGAQLQREADQQKAITA